MRVFITNGFSPGMFIPGDIRIRVEEIREEVELRKLKEEFKKAKLEGRLISALGHQILKVFYEQVLGVELEMRRIKIVLEEGDELITIKFRKRLPEHFIKFLKLQGEKEVLRTLNYYFRKGELTIYRISLIKKYKRNLKKKNK
jgi:hypothetical protein